MTLLHIILAALLILGGTLMVWFIRHQRRQSYMDDIDALFDQTWSGREGEELYVWHLIKSEYLECYPRDEYIRYIDKKINDIDTSLMLSNYSIDEFGNIEDRSREKRIQFN